jgi:hypothetical protein
MQHRCLRQLLAKRLSRRVFEELMAVACRGRTSSAALQQRMAGDPLQGRKLK